MTRSMVIRGSGGKSKVEVTIRIESKGLEKDEADYQILAFAHRVMIDFDCIPYTNIYLPEVEATKGEGRESGRAKGKMSA